MPSNTIQYKTDGAYYNNNKLLTTTDSVSVTDTNATTSGIVNLTDQKLGAGEKTVDKLIVDPGVANTTGIKVPQVTNPHITSTTYQNITVSTKILIPDANGNLIPATFTPGGGTTLTIGEMVAASAKGYFGGGKDGYFFTEIDGIDFTTEAAINPTAALSASKAELAGVNSSSKGYFGGGYSGSYSNEIDGIDFTTEAAINPTATLSIARSYLAGVNSSSKGYFGGAGNEIDGIDFTTEAAINPTATLSVARQGLAGVNSSSKGYFGGGWTGSSYSNEIDGIDFTTEAAINPTQLLYPY